MFKNLISGKSIVLVWFWKIYRWFLVSRGRINQVTKLKLLSLKSMLNFWSINVRFKSKAAFGYDNSVSLQTDDVGNVGAAVLFHVACVVGLQTNDVRRNWKGLKLLSVWIWVQFKVLIFWMKHVSNFWDLIFSDTTLQLVSFEN